jgi:hypothetical protein
MPLLCTVIRAVIRTVFMRKQPLLLENFALRQQLAVSSPTASTADGAKANSSPSSYAVLFKPSRFPTID